MTAILAALITFAILFVAAELIDLVVPRGFRTLAQVVILGPVGWLVVFCARQLLWLVGEILQA